MTTETESNLNRARLLPMLALFLLLAAAYMLTYSGRLAVNDELMMMDVAGSLAEFGDIKYDLANWYPENKTRDPAQEYPLLESSIDPLQMIVAAPLYWIAAHIPRIGLVHFVWLLNVLVCAGIGVVMFIYARALGYPERTATVAALLLGLGTGLWVYSQTFYREPLAMLWLLLGLFLLDRWHTQREAGRFNRALLMLVLAAAMVALAVLTKSVLLATIPAYVLFALPFRERNPKIKRGTGIALVVLLIGAVVFAFTPIIETLVPSGELSIGRHVVDTTFTQTAMHSYLFSIGGSLWGTSPVILLALPGAWLLWKRGAWRHTLFTLAALLGVALTYALLRNGAWFGGASWPPRFLIPLLPFPMLLALPAIDYLLSVRASRWLQAGAALLVIYSVWWQLSGLVFPNGTYSAALPPESNHFADWLPGLNTVRYMRPVVLAEVALDGTESINSAWVRNSAYIAPLLFLLALVASGWALTPFLRQNSEGEHGTQDEEAPVLAGDASNSSRVYKSLPVNGEGFREGFVFWPTLIAGMFLLIGTAWGLRSIYDDPQYLGENEALHAMLNFLEQETHPDDVVILNEPVYSDFMLNYARVDGVRFVTLPLHPGERYSFEQEPQVTSDNPADLLSEGSVVQIDLLAATRERLWLLMETGPFLPWSIRPVERYMAINYYPIREIEFGPTVRLLEYDTTPFDIGEPQESDLRFGESITLPGFTLPDGVTYAPGDSLPVTLIWQADTAINADYTVALFLGDPGLSVLPAQGMDGYPGGGFMPTSAWEPEEYILDNRALRIPQTFPPGSYQLWLRLYRPLDDGTLAILPISGGEILDINGDMGVLPVRVVVE